MDDASSCAFGALLLGNGLLHIAGSIYPGRMSHSVIKYGPGMSSFAGLEKAVAGAIAQKRIGSPVSLRAFFHLSADHGKMMPALGEALAAAERWLGSPPVRVYALGGVRTGEITAMVEYAGGQTALVSVGVLRNPAPASNLILIGNRGTLRFEDDSELGEPGAGSRKLVEAVERSLAAQNPVEVDK